MSEIINREKIKLEALAAVNFGLPPTACRYPLGSCVANYWLEVYEQHAKEAQSNALEEIENE